jgi:hypothetical protein
LEENKKQQ